MAIFTGDEIFRIAVELEQLGEAFYKTLAELSGDQSVKDLCVELAEQESLHAKTFDRMREELTRRVASRPMSWDELSFAQTLVEERVMPDPAVAREVAKRDGLVGVLDMAIQFEKDSILFFREIAESVDEADRAAVEEIVEQEKAHAQRLMAAKRVLVTK